MLAEVWGQVVPRGTGSCDPEDSIDEEAVVLSGSPGVGDFTGEQVLDARPLLVGDVVALLGHVVFAPRCDTANSFSKNYT